SKSMKRETLESLFNRPVTEAAKELGVSTTIVKRLCRRYGIQKWPFRSLVRVQRTMSEVQ
ncbi:RWP-RK domain-containing protein, partial [Tribonema minus]